MVRTVFAGLEWTKEGPKKKKHQKICTNGQMQPQFDAREACGNDNEVGMNCIDFWWGLCLPDR